MPADKYGKKLYTAGTVKSEKAAIANRSTPASRAAAMKIAAQEGTTNPSGGRSASLAAKVAKAVGQPAPPVAPKSSLAAKVAKAVGQPTPPTSRMPLVDKFVNTLKKESTPYTMGSSKK